MSLVQIALHSTTRGYLITVKFMFMKRLVIITLIAFVSYGLQAQTGFQASLRLGIGGTTVGDWDQSGMMVFVQYNKDLNEHFGVAPRLSFLLANNTTFIAEEIIGEEIYAQSSGLSLDVDLTCAPIKKWKRNFYISAGPTIRYMQQTYPSTVSKRTLPDGSTTFEVDQQYYNGFAIGGTVAIDLAATITPKISAGVRGSIQVYTDGPLIPFYGITLGRSLN